jgi:ribosomal-protein-alanine N-acetyltransferase
VVRVPRPGSAGRIVAFERANREHFAPWDPPMPPEFLTEPFWEDLIATYRSDAAADRAVRTCLYLRDDPTEAVIGFCSLNHIERDCRQSARLAFGIDHRHEGKGYMAEALEAVLSLGFERLGLHRIEAAFAPTNERCSRLLRRCGFQIDGYVRDYMFINGEWRDHVLSSRLNPDSPAPGHARGY